MKRFILSFLLPMPCASYQWQLRHDDESPLPQERGPQQWVLEASQYIENNPKECYTNRHVAVVKIPPHEQSCLNRHDTVLRTSPNSKDLYLQWERRWRPQHYCWERREFSGGTVTWEAENYPSGKSEIPLPEDSPYRSQE